MKTPMLVLACLLSACLNSPESSPKLTDALHPQDGLASLYNFYGSLSYSQTGSLAPLSRSLSEFPFNATAVPLLNATQLGGNFCLLDKDADGDTDLFAGSGGVFYLNTGRMPWPRVPTVMPRGVWPADCADANRDGLDDVVAYGGGGYLLGLQGPPGTFTWRIISPFANQDAFAGARQIVVGDVNQDAAPDFVVVNYTSSGGRLSTYLGPTWTRAPEFSIPGSNGYSRTWTAILAGPVQFGAACCDFLISHYYNANTGFLASAQLLLAHRDAAGWLLRVLDPDVERGRVACSAETLDEDQDGDLDFLVGYCVGRGGGIGYTQPPPSPVLFLYRNAGNATFAREAWNTTYSHVYRIVAAPFQGNQTPQVLAIQFDRMHHFWKANGSWQSNSTMLPSFLWVNPSYIHRPLEAAFDANKDGYLDVAVEHRGQVYAFQSTPNPPQDPAPVTPTAKRHFPWLLVIVALVLLIVLAITLSERRRRQ